MRGTPCAAPRVPDGPRFIPAHAGNTKARLNPNQKGTVHPRACGEHDERFQTTLTHSNYAAEFLGEIAPENRRKILKWYLKEHGNGAMLSDIADAVSFGRANYHFRHDPLYYKGGHAHYRNAEIFANAVALEGGPAGEASTNLFKALFPNSAEQVGDILDDFLGN